MQKRDSDSMRSAVKSLERFSKKTLFTQGQLNAGLVFFFMIGKSNYISPLENLSIVEEDGVLREIRFGKRVEERVSGITERVSNWLDSYFRGERKEIDFCYGGIGSPFDISVWREIEKIPYGETISYGDIARSLKDSLSYKNPPFRAVGGAVGRNPLLIVVPCHRVVASHSIGGFGCGLEIKKRLMEIEGIHWETLS